MFELLLDVTDRTCETPTLDAPWPSKQDSKASNINLTRFLIIREHLDRRKIRPYTRTDHTVPYGTARLGCALSRHFVPGYDRAVPRDICQSLSHHRMRTAPPQSQIGPYPRPAGRALFGLALQEFVSGYDR
jgi:hypothetical protein